MIETTRVLRKKARTMIMRPSGLKKMKPFSFIASMMMKERKSDFSSQYNCLNLIIQSQQRAKLVRIVSPNSITPFLVLFLLRKLTNLC